MVKCTKISEILLVIDKNKEIENIIVSQVTSKVG